MLEDKLSRRQFVSGLVGAAALIAGCGGGGGGGGVVVVNTPRAPSPAAGNQQPVTGSSVYATTPAGLTPAQITRMDSFKTAFPTSGGYLNIPASYTSAIDPSDPNVGSLLDIVLSLMTRAPDDNGTTGLFPGPAANQQFALVNNATFDSTFNYYNQLGEVRVDQTVNIGGVFRPLGLDYFSPTSGPDQNVLIVRGGRTAYELIFDTFQGLASKLSTDHTAGLGVRPTTVVAPAFPLAFNPATVPVDARAAAIELAKRQAYAAWMIPNSMQNFGGIYESLVFRNPRDIWQLAANLYAAHRHNHFNTTIQPNQFNDKGVYMGAPNAPNPDKVGLNEPITAQLWASYLASQYTGDIAFQLEGNLAVLRGGTTPADPVAVNAFEDPAVGFNVDYIEN
jgi:hypothetical protein